MSAEQQTLQDASIKIGRSNDEVKTVMKFTKLLLEEEELEILTGDNIFLWAHGSDENLGYHAGRSAFGLNVLTGESQELDLTSSTSSVNDPTGVVIEVDDVDLADTASTESTTIAATIVPDVTDTDLTDIQATEATVTSSILVTEGTIASGDIDIILPTESTTLADSEVTVTPTYYPTVAPQFISEVLTPVADTFVEFNSTKAFGPRKWIKVDGQPERITLIRFDMSSLARNKAVELVSAKLRLFALTNSPFGGTVDIIDQDICGEWDEKTLTWNNAPPGVFTSPPESLGAFGPTQEFEWNEADLTLNLRYIPLQFTMKITTNRANGVSYASKENTTAIPELVIEYMGTPYEETDVPTFTPTEAALVQAEVKLTDSPTASPITAAPTLSPVEPLTIEVRRDAMLRNGKYSDRRFGYDSTIAMKSHSNPDWEGKSILQFDLSDVPSDIDHTYVLKLFITYTGSDDERTLSIYSITDSFRWGEDWITWDRLGNPDLKFLGSAEVKSRDVGSYVSFPLEQFEAFDNRVNFVVEITSGRSGGSKVDYKAREEGSDPPVLMVFP